MQNIKAKDQHSVMTKTISDSSAKVSPQLASKEEEEEDVEEVLFNCLARDSNPFDCQQEDEENEDVFSGTGVMGNSLSKVYFSLHE